MASVRDIAKNSGVSVATVSRVLNNKPNVTPDTRQRVLAEAERVGYSLPRRFASRVIGLAYTGPVGKADYGGFDSALLRGILEGVDEERFDVNIVNLHRDKTPDQSYRSFFESKGVDGVVIRTFDDSRHICADIAAEDIPSIVVADRFEDERINYICTESRADSRRAVEHLIGLGHRRVAICMHAVGDTDHHDRCEGYRQAHREAGIELDTRLEVELVANMEGGANAVSYLLGLNSPPTAIFFTDPLATLGSLQRCRELGLEVPSALSIVGFDDSDVRFHTFPPFTAICQNAGALGQEAAHWLTRRIAGRASESFRKAIPTSFEIHQTTGPAPGRVSPILR